MARDNSGKYKEKHGYYGTPTYSSWTSMKSRCVNKKMSNYKYYGGKNIRVCDRWGTFENFLADMGERPLGMTLDRINSSLGYTPENCRWADIRTQNRNRDGARFVIYRGQRKHINEWSDEIGISAPTLRWRIRHWGMERAFTDGLRSGGYQTG